MIVNRRNLRWWSLCLGGLVLASGCRNNGPLSDPFLRTTVPPPGTGAAQNHAAIEPYTGTPGSAPALPALPATAPSASPYGPPSNAAPGTFQVPPRDKFSPAGGFNYPQGEHRTKPRSGSVKENAVTQQKLLPGENLLAEDSPLSVTRPVKSDLAAALAASPEIKAAARLASAQPSIVFDSNNGLSAGIVVDSPPARAEPKPESQPRKVAHRAPGPSSAEVTMAAAPLKETKPYGGSLDHAPRGETQTTLRIVSSSGDTSTKPSNYAANNVQLASYSSVVPNTLPAYADEIRTQGPTDFQSVTPLATSDYGHGENYEWVQGKLEYSASSRQWKLRYIPIDGRTDAFGGSVVLGKLQLDGAKPGDIVLAQGSLNAPPTKSGFAPNYELKQLDRVVR